MKKDIFNKKGTLMKATCAEMEFLDINLTKDLSLLLHAIRSPLLQADFKENHTILWFSK